MKNTALALIAGLLAAASPAAAEEFTVAADATAVVQAGSPAIPWEAHWADDAEPPAADAADDAEIAAATRSGPPTTIVPAAYSLR